MGATILTLTLISSFLFLGLLLTILSIRINFPRQLLLIFLGLFFSFILSRNQSIITIPNEVIEAIALMALALVVFSGTSNLSLKEIDESSSYAVKVVFLWLFLMFLLSPLVMLLLRIEFSQKNFLYTLGFVSLLIATDASIIFDMFKDLKTKIVNIIQVESIINTPISTLIPITIIYYINKYLQEDVVWSVFSTLKEIVNSFIVGIGVGILFGIIAIKIIKYLAEYYPELNVLNSSLLVASTLLIYFFSEIMEGTGIVSVAVFGIMYSKIYIKGKNLLKKFESVFAEFLQILVYVLLGTLILIDNVTMKLFMDSLLIFLIMIFTRALVTLLTIKRREFTKEEVLFAIFNTPKGLATAVVILTLLMTRQPLLVYLGELSLAVTIYSILIAIIFTRILYDDLKKIEMAEKGTLPLSSNNKVAQPQPAPKKKKN